MLSLDLERGPLHIFYSRKGQFLMMQQDSRVCHPRKAQQAGRLLGSMLAAEDVCFSGETWANERQLCAFAKLAWESTGRSLAAEDTDLRIFLRAYKDAYRAYRH